VTIVWDVRRLRDYNDVTLILEGRRAPAVVVATAGDRVWLEPHRDSQRVESTLPASARISFAYERQFVMLSGRALRHPTGCIEFRGEDQGRVENVRKTARLAVELPVTITVTGAQPVQTKTVDLGRGGLLAAAPYVAPAGAEATLDIEMPDDVPDVSARGRVVRTAPQGTAFEFLELDAAEADRLETIVIAVRRRIAQRKIEISKQEGRVIAMPPGR
jgi:hypothetical protein